MTRHIIVDPCRSHRRSGEDVAVTHRRPGEGPYARVEREQRWVATHIPAEAARTAEILDRYIRGTRLRLRRAETADEIVFKLGQKVRLDPQEPTVVKLTNIYLSTDEYAVMATLAAAELRKTRWHVSWAGAIVAIDEFHDRLSGILLAEAEIAPAAAALPLPAFAVRDVTHDDRFSGGALAFASDTVTRGLVEEAAGR